MAFPSDTMSISGSISSDISESSFNVMLEQIRQLRLMLTPFLPPPVLSAMRLIDAYLKDITEEASTIIFVSAILSWFILQFVRVMSNNFPGKVGNSNRGLYEENDVMGGISSGRSIGSGGTNNTTHQRIVGTVVLCGPSNVGKTVLFHALCCDSMNKTLLAQIPVATVTSLQAADRVVPLKNDDDDDDAGLRLLDYPGHASLRSSLPQALLQAMAVVLVLDATKPVSDAADVLYMLLTHPRLPWNCGSNNVAASKNRKRFQVLVACHKADLTLAKNPKRIKLQMRTELERLRKIKQQQQQQQTNGVTFTEPASLPLGIPGKVLDLDDKRLSCDITFVASTCYGKRSKKVNSTSSSSSSGGSVVMVDPNEGWKTVFEFVHGVSF